MGADPFVFTAWTIHKDEWPVKIHTQCFNHILEFSTYKASCSDTLWFAVNII